jgi:uncharacterized membrane protein YhiD involved in acid resistance
MKRRDRLVLLVVALAAGVLGFALMAYIFSDRNGTPAQPTAAPAAQTAASPTPTAAAPSATPRPAPVPGENIFEYIFGSDPEPTPRAENLWHEVLRILWRLALAALLAALLAFRPRRDLPILKRNLYVAQTQILLAVVASSLMMVVGDNAARAFGIFAAVSFVRFRTNIRDPKEVTVLLISLALGLATGVGRWEVALVLTAFVLPLLWVLERAEHQQVFRAMQLTVKTRNADVTQEVLRVIFRRNDIVAEMRELDPPDEKEPIGTITYHVNMALNVSTDAINDQILEADPTNVEGIEWAQQKNTGYVYN